MKHLSMTSILTPLSPDVDVGSAKRKILSGMREPIGSLRNVIVGEATSGRGRWVFSQLLGKVEGAVSAEKTEAGGV